MSEKRKKDKLKRKFISLATKLEILEHLKQGEKTSSVSRKFNLNEATVRTIQKNEKKIKSSVAAGCSTSAGKTARPRAPIIEKMEKALNIWIEDCTKKRIPLGTNIVREKALKIYSSLKERGELSVTPDVGSSKGWFERFKNRFCLHNIKLQGESASADSDAATKYPAELQTIIERGGYTAHQVFNADETGLWWKKMPSRTFISKEEKSAPGFKASKDRLTLLLCSNASGDYMVKSMLVYRSLNPRALKSVNKNLLPVYWTANKKSWVTTELFKRWFFDCFVPNVENYVKQKNLDFKVLLVLDNAPSHPKNLTHPNVEIVFLPPNTSSLIQPLDQGIISTFKSHYIRQSMRWVLEKVDSECIDIMAAWKHFSILDCVNITSLSLNEVKQSTLNACWKNIWPEVVQHGSEIEPEESRITAIIDTAKSLGKDFGDITPEDIQELLVDKETDEAHLIEMVSPRINSNSESDSSNESIETPDFTLKTLKKGIDLAEELQSHFLCTDPSTERSLKFKRELQKCLAPYNEIYKDLQANQKQKKMTDFFKTSNVKNEISDEESVDETMIEEISD